MYVTNTLNSGKRFLTSWETIANSGNCMLASMFKGAFKCTTDEDGFAFIDRDGASGSIFELKGDRET